MTNRMTRLEKLIRDRLGVLDMTVHAFCIKAEIPRTTLYRVFKAEGRYSMHTLQRIAKALGCKIVVLLEAEKGGCDG